MRRALRWLGVFASATTVAIVACSSSQSVDADAGTSAAPEVDARAIRKGLHGENPAPKVAPKRADLPFVSPATPVGFALVAPPARDVIEAPAPPAGPSTFVLPSVIAPMPDRSGRYVMRRRDSSTFFTSSGLSFALSGGTKEEAKGWGLHCTIVGGRDGALVTEEQQAARVNTYVGALSVTDAPTFARVSWDEVYPGIDMVAEPTRGGVAYRFVLSPGAKVSDIALRWDGATSVKIVDDGRGVDVATDIGVLGVRGLRAFAVKGDQRTELAVRHVARASGEIGLEVDGWDGREPLIIDPAIVWSSYLGGGSTDMGQDIAVDGSDNALITGYTSSTDFPSSGGFRGGDWDGFVTKVSGSGTLLWSSYIGGTSADYGQGVGADLSGNVFVTGYTNSTDYPSAGGFRTTFGGGSEAFVTKISGAGVLLWSSYLGGALNDQGRGIAVDGSGDALLTGFTTSTDFPTSGGFKTTFGPQVDAFVTKVSGAGLIVWSSYLGGALYDYGNSLSVDGSGNAFVTGFTSSTDFPSGGGFKTIPGGGDDAFVTKISSAGALLWSSYLGGASNERGAHIGVDGSGSAFVTGFTNSVDFPVSGGFRTTLGGGQDAFLTKVSGSGALLWSSYLGGGASDVGNGAFVDRSGNAFVTGTTGSSDFPISGAFKATHSGVTDAFVIKVSSAGTIVWSSYLGGAADDYGWAIAVDASANAFVTGYTKDFPTIAGFDTTFGGGSSDAFVTKLTAKALGASCVANADCLSATCVDGVCCDRACVGKCEACTAVKKGSGDDGACGLVKDGIDPERECATQSCSAGTLTRAQLCDGAGACRTDGTTTCGLYASCSGAECATTCIVDADCLASAYCSGTTCVADLGAGVTCARDAQCPSNVCADGVCCDKACTGACEACSASAKGKGADGICEPVAAGTDPHDKCLAGTGTCPADGFCDGAGSCRSFAKAATACGATTCSDGLVTGKICKGDSAVCIDSSSACAPYACGGAACKASCTTDGDCDPTAFCSASGTCATKSAGGASCGSTHECASGFCADGVCCNAPCTGPCEFCAATGTVGRCTPVKGDPRGGRPACKGAPCPGTCDGINGGSCSYEAGKECAASCSAGTQTISNCDKTGACVAAPANLCTAYVCDGSTRCKSRCTSQADCATNFSCKDGKCEPLAVKCSDDGTASINDTDGTRTECAPFRCDPTSSACKGACANDADCITGLVCNSSGRCEAAPAATDEAGGCAVSARTERGAWLGFLASALLVTLVQRRRSRV